MRTTEAFFQDAAFLFLLPMWIPKGKRKNASNKPVSRGLLPSKIKLITEITWLMNTMVFYFRNVGIPSEEPDISFDSMSLKSKLVSYSNGALD